MLLEQAALASAQANLSLEKAYGETLEKWRTHAKNREDQGQTLSIPCFLKTEPAYFSSDPRILFVGQETHGWWTNCETPIEELRVEQIMDFYIGIKAWLFEEYGRSSYWAMIRKIVSALELGGCPQSFLISNVFPCDLNKKRPPLELHPAFRDWKVLAHEVKIVQPDWIIFFCGPQYYGNLKAYFGEWPSDPVSKEKLVIPFRPAGHSWKGLVTYHPNRLRWTGLTESARLQILSAIAAG